MNLILYNQLQKLEHKSQFLREFWKSFELEMADIEVVKEETLAERVCLSVLKSGEVKNS